MKIVRRIAVLTALAVLMLIADVLPLPTWLPLDVQLVPDAHAVAGRQRRTRRRGVAVGYEAGQASASASQQQAASQQQDPSQQQAASQQQQTPAPPPPAPSNTVTALPDGCATAGDLFHCGDVYYKAYISGNEVLYAQVPAPE